MGSVVKAVSLVEMAPTKNVKAPKPQVIQVSSKTPEERKAAFKARKNQKKRLAKKQLENAIARLPECVAERKRLRKEAKEKKAALHRKISKHKKQYYAAIKANPSLRKAKKYNGKKPKYQKEAKAKNAKHIEAVKAQKKKLEDLAGM